MVILIDTKEQKPWDLVGESQRVGLKTGDYSVLGLQDRLVIERKSLTDLANTVVGDWLRFCKQLRRMASMDSAVIAVESSVDELLAYNYTSDVKPMSVLGRCSAITLDYGIPVLFLGSRESAQVWAGQYLALAVEKYGRT